MESQVTEHPGSLVSDISEGPILVATDGNPHADTALIAAAFIAGRVGGKVQVFSVVEHASAACRECDNTAGPSHVHRESPQQCRVHREFCEERDTRRAMIQAQVALTVGEAAKWPITVYDGPVGQTSCDIVTQSRAQLMVIGQRRQRSLDVQSETDRATEALMQCTVPIYIAAPTFRGIARRVVVAVDFTAASIHAANIVRSLSARDARMYLIHVVPYASAEELDERRRQLLNVEQSLRDESGVRVESIMLLGDAARETLSFAEGIQADVIACGLSGRRGISSAADPSSPAGDGVTRDLIRNASCSMLIAPRLTRW
ncbi:MAG TPA: universal stress protein [Gemmatimonadaceae bacterium]|nr:universal stress protein [Gemmatimonadaceae bacterium]